MKWRRGSWSRLKEIAEVLAHHGLLFFADSLGLSWYLGLGKRLRAQSLPTMDANWPERVRLVLADLGPTYVKLGQLASIRPDVLPDPLVRSLEHLQDDVPPFPYEVAVDIVERAWGRPLFQVVQRFGKEPMAAASIGQVYEAQLYDGRRVVVKIRRPDIVERSESDFRILKIVAERAEKRSEWARQNGLTNLVDELVSTMRDELDFTVEAQNTEAAGRQVMNSATVLVPRVIWGLTHQNVLVLQSLGGIKINNVRALAEMGIDRERTARHFIHALYQQIFLRGFFHADPHPGNVHVDAAGRLIFLDWGMVGLLSQDLRRRSSQLVMGLVQGRSDSVAEALMAVGSVTGHVDRRALTRDIDRLRHRYYESTLKDFALGQALGDLFHVAERHHMRVPSEYLLMAKTAVTADGVVRALDPDFSLVEMGKPLALELLWSRVNPGNWVGEAASQAVGIGARLARIPEELEGALHTLSRGEIRIVLEHQNIDRILGHWAKLADHLAFTFLLGSILLGTALVVHPSHLDHLAGLPLPEYAFLVIGAVALWVLVRAFVKKRL